MVPKMKKIAISGGGTAGHVFPALAVMKEIKKLKKDSDFLYLGSKGGFEAKIIPQEGFRFISIPCGKIRKYFDPIALVQDVVDLIKIPFGLLKSFFVLRKEKPDAIFIKGGYVSLPVGLSASLLKIPFLIHESDLELGLANRVLSRFASKIAVSFPKDFYNLPQEKLIFSGNPIREKLVEGNKKKALKFFNLGENLPTILIIGGSQGARKINYAILDCLPELLKSCQIIHLVGFWDWEDFSKKYHSLADKEKTRYKIFKFLEEKELGLAYAVSDLIVSRGGANVLAEISALGKPSILIPIPGHQENNIRFYTKKEAGEFISNKVISGKVLSFKIKVLLSHPSYMKKLAKNIKKLSHPGAAKILAKEVLSLRKVQK